MKKRSIKRLIRILSATIGVITLLAANSAVASSFYVSQAGSDANDGRSLLTPWLSINRINSGFFAAGDTINLRGGDIFQGCVTFNAVNVAATQGASPVKVQNYGSGIATLVSNCPGKIIAPTLGPRSAALTIDGISGFDWNGPSIRGSDPTTPTQYGVIIENESPSVAASNITIENSDISGFMVPASATADASAEVFVLGYSLKGACGPLNTIRILNNKLHGATVTSNDDNGIMGYGCAQNVVNVLYQGNQVYDMGGRKAAPNGASGNGMILNGVNGGVEQYNVVHDNGSNTTTCGGPGGIWAYSSSNVTIQFNEVYRMQPLPAFQSGCDWAAFDLDAYVTNSVVQYNFSHDNAGPGLLAFTGGGGSSWHDNTFRYNISQNDNPLILDGGGSIALDPGSSLYVYGNTIYRSGTSLAQNPPSCWSTGYNGAYVAPVIIANNICVNASTDRWNRTRMVDGSNGATGLNNITMVANDYYNAGNGSTGYMWGSNSYANLVGFQAGTGQESRSVAINPLISNAGGGTTIGSTAGPQPGPAAYRLGVGSPVIGAGVNLSGSPYTLSVGNRDYFNGPVPNLSASGFNMGAQN